MGLLTTYSDTNKVYGQGSTVRKDKTLAYWNGWPVWVVTETTEESYRYVGMTKAAAISAATSINTSLLVTRTVSTPSINEYGVLSVTTSDKQVQTGYAKPVRESGSMWTVEVQINDTVTTYETFTAATT